MGLVTEVDIFSGMVQDIMEWWVGRAWRELRVCPLYEDFQALDGREEVKICL